MRHFVFQRNVMCIFVDFSISNFVILKIFKVLIFFLCLFFYLGM